MPPPMPVSMPIAAAIGGAMPYSRAFCVPATANRARPIASNSRTGWCSFSISDARKKVTTPAASEVTG